MSKLNMFLPAFYMHGASFNSICSMLPKQVLLPHDHLHQPLSFINSIAGPAKQECGRSSAAARPEVKHSDNVPTLDEAHNLFLVGPCQAKQTIARV